MDDVDMEAKEPSDEAESPGSHQVFKTPMILNCCKLQGPSANDSSSCVSSPYLLRSPDFSFSKESLLSSTQLTHSHLNEIHSSDLRSKESELFGSSGISSPRVIMQKRFDMSPDSGVDCASFCSSVKDSAIIDSDEDQQSHSSSAVIATTPGFASASQTQEIIPGCQLSAASVHDINKLWQSTPINADLRNACPMFEDSCELEKSPSKRHKPSVKKASRDLFHNSRRKINSSFPQPLPWEHTSSPNCPQNCMNGRETVDFLFYLGKHSIHQPALDAILGYLEPADLCRATVVSRSWKNVVEGVPSAKLRKKDYVDRCIQIKENLHQTTKKSEGSLPIRGQLISIQNFSRSEEVQSRESRSPPVSPSKAVFNLFLKEGRKLENGQTFLKCPQCKLPSRKESLSSARCTRSGCQYHFCVLCFCKFHGDKACPVSIVRHRKRLTAIGSRESRRNLQRLCK